MALTTTKSKGIRQLADGQAPTLRADIAGIVADIGTAVWPSGTALPSAAADKWPGRMFFHDSEDTLYVCSDALVWLPVGGQHTIDPAVFGTPAAGYAFDNTNGASFVYRNGRRIDFRLRITKASGVLTHGHPVFQVSAAFLPAGVGSWPLAGLQSGSGQGSVIGAALQATGVVSVNSPSGVSTTLEVSGFYYIP